MMTFTQPLVEGPFDEDFAQTITNRRFYIDKTLLIRDLFNKESLSNKKTVSVITRPRRFGKSLNLSMLKYFFDITLNSEELFKGSKEKGYKELAIWKYQDIVKKHLNMYPVLHLDFKGVGGKNNIELVEKLKVLIYSTYTSFLGLIEDDPNIHQVLRDRFKEVVTGVASALSPAYLPQYLDDLMNMLVQKYQKNVILLIDEYDAPLTSAYSQGYFKEAIIPVRDIFEKILKTSKFLQFGVVTGINYVAKNSIFSGLNSVDICTIMDNSFANYFGFTQEEVDWALKIHGLLDKKEEVKQWYDGYEFGNSAEYTPVVYLEDSPVSYPITIYNPWSILGYLRKRVPTAYWSQTSSNDIIKEQIRKHVFSSTNPFFKLAQGETVEAIISPELTFQNVGYSQDDLYTLLFHAGYLKIVGEKNKLSTLQIVNREIREIFENAFLNETRMIITDNYDVNNFIQGFLDLDIKKMTKHLNSIIENLAAKNKEYFYHGILSCVFASLNKEIFIFDTEVSSGSGYADMIIKYKDNKQPAYIIEVKVGAKEGEGLKQILEKGYVSKLIKEGYTTIYPLEIIIDNRQVKHIGIGK
jgi:hypothetical protein